MRNSGGGGSSGTDELLVTRVAPALHDRVLLFLGRHLIEFKAAGIAEPVLPPIPAIKVQIAAETGDEPRIRGRWRRFPGHTSLPERWEGSNRRRRGDWLLRRSRVWSMHVLGNVAALARARIGGLTHFVLGGAAHARACKISVWWVPAPLRAQAV